jgi:hypothetical protein
MVIWPKYIFAKVGVVWIRPHKITVTGRQRGGGYKATAQRDRRPSPPDSNTTYFTMASEAEIFAALGGVRALIFEKQPC